MSEVIVPDLLEVRPDSDGVSRLYIDGELFKYGTVEGVTVGPIMREEEPSVTLRIVGMRVTVDWSHEAKDGKRHSPVVRWSRSS